MAEHRAHWGRLIGASLVVLAVMLAAPLVIPAPDLQENRDLATFPSPPRDLAGLTAFRRGMDAYVADHFPARAHLVGGLNRLRLQFGVSGSPRVVVGRDGWMFDDDGSHLGAVRGEPGVTDAAARAWLEGLAGRTEAMAAQGRTYLVLSPPTKAALYPWEGPWWFKLDINRPAVTLARLARVSRAGKVLYLNGVMTRESVWGLRTYTPHDTHWTGLGAYLGYAALMQTLQAEGRTEGPRPLTDFREMREGEENKPRNLALMLGVSSFVDVDYPELGDPVSDEATQITYLTGRRDWTGARLIDTGEAGKPVLLMTVDSFSNALLPFLYSHFSRIVVAHIDQGPWRPDLIARFNPDIVVTEVVESGLPRMMQGGPAASSEAAARIRVTVARRQRYALEPRGPKRPGHYKRIDGTDAGERLRGSKVNDDIQAKPGNDTLEGLAGDDALRGGRGDDRVDGGDGDDWVSGDRGDDVLVGGRGEDVFHGCADCGTDVIADFSVDEADRIELDPGMTFTLRQEGEDTVVELSGGRLILKGVRMGELPARSIRVRRPVLAQPS